MDGISGFFSLLYDSIASFGSTCAEYALLLFNSVLKQPLIFLYTFFRRTLRLIFRLCVLFFAPADAPSSSYADDVTRAGKQCIKTLFTHPGSFPHVVLYYIKKALKRYNFRVGTVMMWVLPVITAAAVFFGLSALSDKEMALEISLDGEVIGYTASEKDYIKAKNEAEEKLSQAENGAKLLSGVSYRLTLIDVNEFTDTSVICDRLMKKTDSELVSACGVFADGKLLSVLYSENDIRNALEDILKDKKLLEENYAVSFAEEIEIRHGLYPEETVSTLNEFRELIGLDEEGNGILGYKEVKTEVVGEEINFDTVRIESSALYSGSKRVLSQGKKGYAQVTNFVTYLNGERAFSEEAARITVAESVPERVQIGTKPLDEAYSNSMGGIFLWPIVGAYGINSDYGYRWGKLHAGLDLGMGNAPGTSLGKDIVAVASGTVQVAAVHSSYGYYLILDHGNGLQTLYAHCLADSFYVVPGQTVVAGQPIARVGSTGYSTGPHLHFEVRVNGNRVNPRPYLGI